MIASKAAVNTTNTTKNSTDSLQKPHYTDNVVCFGVPKFKETYGLYPSDLLRNVLANLDCITEKKNIPFLLHLLNNTIRYGIDSIDASTKRLSSDRDIRSRQTHGPIHGSASTIKRMKAALIEQGLSARSGLATGTPTHTVNIKGLISLLPNTDLIAGASLTINGTKIYYGEFISRVMDCPDMFDSAREYRALLWLLQRTFAYGKRKEGVYLNQILQGVYSDGECVQCPMGINHNGWKKAAKWLEKKGFIKRVYHNGRDLKIEVCMDVIDSRMTTLSKLKTPKSYKKRTNCTKNDQNSLGQKRSMAWVKPRRLKSMLIQEYVKDVVSKDTTSDSDKIDSTPKPDQECNPCNELPIPSTSVPSAAQAADPKSFPMESLDAAPAADENVPSTFQEDAPQMEENISSTESLDAALAAAKQRNAAATKKSANSIFTKITKSNLSGFWKQSLPEFGHTIRNEKLDTASWGSIRNSDKSRRDYESFGGVPEIMRWAIRYWGEIVYPKMRWTAAGDYKTVPTTKQPSLVAFCRHYSHIAVLFDEFHSSVATLVSDDAAREAGNRNMADAQENLELHAKVVSLTKALDTAEGDNIRRLRREESRRADAEYAKRLEEQKLNPITEEEMQDALDWVVPEWGDAPEGVVQIRQGSSKPKHGVRDLIHKTGVQA